MRSKEGFTIIELVVVIVIIGILAATALPRFVNFTDDAHSTNVQAMGTSIRSGVSLSHAAWIARGATANVNSIAAEGGVTIGVTDAGWPQNALAAGGDGTPTAAECVDLWNAMLNSPPSVATVAGSDWLAAVTATDNCQYTYNAAPGRTIAYDVGNGSVTITVP